MSFCMRVQPQWLLSWLSFSTLRQVILLEHEIPHDSFSGKVLACLPSEDWAITPENSVGRKDLRHLPVLSIDPPGCKDIDDALHARPLDNGNIEVRPSHSTFQREHVALLWSITSVFPV